MGLHALLPAQSQSVSHIEFLAISNTKIPNGNLLLFMTSPSPVSEKIEYTGSGFLYRAESDLRRYNKWIVDLFLRNIDRTFLKEAAVLDFGAGIGTLSQVFLARTGIRPDTVELDQMQREILVSRGFKAYRSLESTSRRYTLIFTSNVLEHIEDDVATLRSLHEHLDENGILAIYVPAFMLLWTSLDDQVGHYRRYRIGELTEKLNRAGFQVSTARYCDSLGFILAILFKFIGSKDGEPSTMALRIFDRYLLPISKAGDFFSSRIAGKNVLIVARPVPRSAR